MDNLKRGLFIAFDGIDGCGKTMQIYKFVEYFSKLNKHNHILVTREPYKDHNIREILRSDTNPLSQAEKLADLFIQDRINHVNECILPALEKGHHVVTDRFKFSTIAYQAAQGLDIQNLINRHNMLPIPVITFIIDVTAEVAAQRMKKEEDRKEQKFESNLEFQEAVRQNYHKAKELLKNERIFIIDGNQEPEKVFADIKTIFEREVLNADIKKRYNSLDEVPDYIKEKLKKYFTNVGGDIFAITGLPAELTGGALARYSRTPTGMQLTMINEFFDENGEPSQEKGSELIDRVLNAFGDDSIGELEGIHVGIENISQILTKTFEDRRIGGSPIEQSTRYVKFDQKDKNGKWKYLRPLEVMNSPIKDKYEKVNDLAFEIYSEAIKRLVEYFKMKLPEDSFEIEIERNKMKMKIKKADLEGEEEAKAFKTAYGFTVRCAALDVARCTLPASTLTQLGLYGNGRFFTNVINALKSGELEEERQKGLELEKELKKVIPTFIKRNKCDPEVSMRNKRMRELTLQAFKDTKPTADRVTLVYHRELIDEVVANSFFPYTNISLQQIQEEVKNMSYMDKQKILDIYIGKRNSRRDRTPRGLEAGYPITFDLVGCFAEYRDLQRHRMLTQQRQLLSTDLGFVMPAEIVEVGLGKEVEELVKLMEELNFELKQRGLIITSQYATLFNHRMRFVMGMNLREFQHLSELRTQPAGHFSYRSMTMEMAKALEKRDPWTKRVYEFVDFSDPGNKISRAKEQAKIAGKNLAKGVDSSIDF